MSLQERVRYFEYMRPRYSNPSFASSNVGASMGMTFMPEHYESKPIIKNSSAVIQPRPSITRNQTPQSPKLQQNGRRSKSHLSSYGTSSLGNLPKFINERDIYQKQQKKYNIITILPKEYNETIKKYPKYHLQNMDQNYYKKLKLQEQYKPVRSKMPNIEAYQTNPEQQRAFQAKQTPKKVQHEQPTYQKPQKTFRPKMLNNIDELSGVL